MTIFKHKRTGVLYTGAWVSPRMMTGKWYEFTPLHGNGRVIKPVNLNDFIPVAHR